MGEVLTGRQAGGVDGSEGRRQPRSRGVDCVGEKKEGGGKERKGEEIVRGEGVCTAHTD